MVYQDLPFFADATDEESWRAVARDSLIEHINKPIKSISLNINIPEVSDSLMSHPLRTPPPPPPGTSLYDQIIYNASQHTPIIKNIKRSMEPATPQSTKHHHGHSRTPLSKRTPKGKGSNPTAGFRYLQQMKNEQVALKKMVQAVLDKRNSVDEGYTLAQLDRDLPAPTDKRIPCALCDFVFPESQLVGKISLQAVCNWKDAHNVPTTALENTLSEEKSVYLRALDSVKRLQVVALCVFCTQFFDVNMGDYIEPELIKQDVGVEDIIKGPLNRPSHIYKKLLRSFSLDKTHSNAHNDSHSYSQTDSHIRSVASLDRPQSRESYEDKIRNLKSRSVQKVVTLTQARTLKNKYVTVEKILESMESLGQKSKRAHSVDSPLRIERRYVPLISLSDIAGMKGGKKGSKAKRRGKSLGRTPSQGSSKLFLSRDSRDSQDIKERRFFLTTAEEASVGGGASTLATVPEEGAGQGQVKKVAAGRAGSRTGSKLSQTRTRSLSPALASSLLAPRNNSSSHKSSNNSVASAQKRGRARARGRAVTLSPTRRSSRSVRARPAPTPAPSLTSTPKPNPTISPQKRRARSVGWTRGRGRARSEKRGVSNKRDKSSVSRGREASKKPETSSNSVPSEASVTASNPPIDLISAPAAIPPPANPKPRAPLLFAIQKKSEKGQAGEDSKVEKIVLTTTLLSPSQTPTPSLTNPTNSAGIAPSDPVFVSNIQSCPPEGISSGTEEKGGLAAVEMEHPVITNLRGKNKFRLLRRKQLEDREKAALISILPTPIPSLNSSVDAAPVVPVPERGSNADSTPGLAPISTPTHAILHNTANENKVVHVSPTDAHGRVGHKELSPTQSQLGRSHPHLSPEQNQHGPSPPFTRPSTLPPTPIQLTPHSYPPSQYFPTEEYADDFERDEGVGLVGVEAGPGVRDSFPVSPLPFRLPSRRGVGMRESGEGIRLLSRGQLADSSESVGGSLGWEGGGERIDLLSPATRPHSSSVRTPSQRTRSRGGMSWEVRKMQIL